MPLVRIAVRRGTSAQVKRGIGDSVHRAMTETINVPQGDRFQIFTEHDAGDLVYDPSFLGVDRTDGFLVIQITMAFGRTVEQKQTLYRRIAELVTEHGVRPENVFISLVEVGRENWSFGNGIAQYVVAPPPPLAAAAPASAKA